MYVIHYIFYVCMYTLYLNVCRWLFSIAVSIWRPRRKYLAPTFSPKNLLQFAEIFNRQSGVMADQLRSVAGKGTFSIWKYITAYSMDSVFGRCIDLYLL